LLSCNLIAQVEYDEQIAALKDSVKVKVERYGENNKEVVNTRFDLAEILFKNAKYKEAKLIAEKCLEICLGLFGEKHASTATSYNNLGVIFQKTGDYQKALRHHQKALEIYLEVLGEKHASTINSYNSIASVFYQKGDYSKALEYYQKVMEIYPEVLGEKHASTANSYNNIATVHSERGNYSKALELHQKALEIYLEVLGKKHASTATSYNNIGAVYFEMGNYTKALKYYQEALEIKIEVLEEKHPSLIYTQVNLALSLENLALVSRADSLWNVIIPSLIKQLNNNYLFLPDDKKVLYLNTIDDMFRTFYHFTKNYGGDNTKSIAADLLINSKSQILDYTISTRQLIKNINDNNLNSIALQLSIINQKVAQAGLLTKNELKQRGWSSDSLSAQKNNLLGQILEHPKVNSKLNPIKVSWQQIQGKLRKNEALIDYYAFYDRISFTWVYQAMFIKKDEIQPLFIPISSTKPVINLLKLRENLPLYLQFKETRQEMYSYIWQAIAPYLENINTIHLAPVASLNKIDFESLQNETGQYLADLYNFHYYTSSKDFYKQKSGKQTMQVPPYMGT